MRMMIINNYDVKLTEIARGTKCDCDAMQSRRLNENPGDNLNTVTPDPRKMSAEGVASLIEENGHLTSTEKQHLVQLLLKYLDNLTTKLGICRVFEYIFEVNSSAPVVGDSRPIPFSLRPVVREQMRQLLEDGIVEHSTPPTCTL